jgi:hypothetical protein
MRVLDGQNYSMSMGAISDARDRLARDAVGAADAAEASTGSGSVSRTADASASVAGVGFFAARGFAFAFGFTAGGDVGSIEEAAAATAVHPSESDAAATDDAAAATESALVFRGRTLGSQTR